MDVSLERYQRQMLLPGFGEEGQRRLRESTALVLGCGALGTVVADMLARAGVGHLVIVDRDFIELTNLQRQVLFDEQDVANADPKAIAAARKLAAVNSSVRITPIVDDINYTNIARFARGADIFVDGLDNFETRYLANDFAVKHALPYVYGAAVGATGMAFAILPHGDGSAPWESGGDNLATPCLRCLFEEAPPPGASPTCDTVGVMNTTVGVIANFEVAEALKILTGNFERVNRTLLNLDLWANEILQLNVENAYAKGDCPCCKHARFDYLDGHVGSEATSLCGRDAVQLRHRDAADAIDLQALATRLREHGNVRVNEHLLRADITESNKRYEISLFADGRAIIKGTTEADVARSLYARYVGN